MTDQPGQALWQNTVDATLSHYALMAKITEPVTFPGITALPLARYEAMRALCAAMAQWLANQQHWTDLPDYHVVLESRATDGTAEFRITAGMIRAAVGGTGA